MTFLQMELNGKKISDYEIDVFMMDEEEMDPAHLLFTWAEFENGKSLTENQLVKLSKKYPEVIYSLLLEVGDLSEDSPHHEKYGALVATLAAGA